MIKRTFADVSAELGRVASQTGLRADDPRLKEIVFLVQERLSTMGEWPYQYARVKFRQVGGVIALPSEYEAIVHFAANRHTMEVMPPWYEFLEYGPGPFNPSDWAMQGMLDQGESPVFYQPGSRVATIKVTSTEGTDTGDVTVFGYDENGAEKSEAFALPETTTTTKWSKIVRVAKPVTVGEVVITFSDDFGVQTLGASYRPKDTAPSFRTYRVAGLLDGRSVTVDAIVRRRLQKINVPTDELFITNLSALRLGVKAIALEDKGDVAAAAQAFELAKNILCDEAKLYRASRNPAPVNVSRVATASSRPDIY